MAAMLRSNLGGNRVHVIGAEGCDASPETVGGDAGLAWSTVKMAVESGDAGLKMAEAEKSLIRTTRDRLTVDMNTLGLVAAFVLASVVPILVSVSKEELVEADMVWANTTLWRIGRADRVTPLSSWILFQTTATCSAAALCTMLSQAISLMCARIPQTSIGNDVIEKYLLPFVSLCYVMLLVSFSCALSALYYVAWAKFPETVVAGLGFYYLGISCLVVLSTAFIFFIYVHAVVGEGGTEWMETDWPTPKDHPMHFTGAFFFALLCLYCLVPSDTCVLCSS